MIQVKYVDHMGDDMRVANAARVSFAKYKDEFDHKDEKLIRYLAEHKHMSPFGHCFLSVHVKAPIFVARQLVKHKFLRWNEVSRRYVDDEPEFYSPRKWREKAPNKKQGSSDVGVDILNYYGTNGKNGVDDPYLTLCEIAYETYQELLDKGVCPEQARMVLPQSAMTEWYWSGSLDAFTDMCNLRLKEDTQYETRLVAQQVRSILLDIFPVSAGALINVD